MAKQLSRIAPWQAGKVFALVYFFASLLFVIPMLFVSLLGLAAAAPGPKLTPGVVILLPFLYALFGLIFVPFGCWIYNIAASLVGGLVVSVTDNTDG
jgi:hypothetical protein